MPGIRFVKFATKKAVGDDFCMSHDWLLGWETSHQIIGSTSYPSGKHTNSYGKSLFLMGKSTIFMVIFHSFL